MSGYIPHTDQDIGKMKEAVGIKDIGELAEIITFPAQKEGQGELRGKPHRSNRCKDFAANEDRHLRRRKDRSIGPKLDDEWQRLCWFTEQLTLSTPRSHYSNRTNPKEKNGKTPPIAQDISGIPPALRRSKFQSSSTISWM